MNLVLIGPPGSGKTRLGKRVARLLELPFLDTDKLVVAEHGPIAALFAEHGEPHFRALERSAVRAALAERAVVALGGGAILDKDTQRDLAAHRVALITVSPEAVAPRIGGTKRPLLAGGLDAWRALVDARRPIYERLADASWDTSDRPLDDIARDIATWAEGDITHD
ncbi:shikimate kinase [Galbitalea soli]|uniref:Shikimate kinase n=1 Tax=Galbitalea soli TaxID=1268042 RepID=A0A7C9TPD1_9MICO|nr:shikimate kinase [Galbitalea soli]NYJ30927.1 shikimate kinase [Galbitalea soli]